MAVEHLWRVLGRRKGPPKAAQWGAANVTPQEARLRQLWGGS